MSTRALQSASPPSAEEYVASLVHSIQQEACDAVKRAPASNKIALKRGVMEHARTIKDTAEEFGELFEQAERARAEAAVNALEAIDGDDATASTSGAGGGAAAAAEEEEEDDDDCFFDDDLDDAKLAQISEDDCKRLKRAAIDACDSSSRTSEWATDPATDPALAGTAGTRLNVR